MRFIVYTGRLFVLLTVLNIANLITNMGAGSAEDLLSQMAINHADCPSNAQGLVELLNSAVMWAPRGSNPDWLNPRTLRSSEVHLAYAGERGHWRLREGPYVLRPTVSSVGFLFWMRGQMHSTASRLKAQFEGNTAKLTAAGFSVMVDNCPPSVSSDELRAAFGKFGTVVHVGIALDNRELVLGLEARQAPLLPEPQPLDLAWGSEP